MGNNTLTLIDTLRNGLCGRFSDVRVVNRNPTTGERDGGQGVLSVVFRAHDHESQRDVALKFFDPDLMAWPDRHYRMALFEREAELLGRLRGKSGLLQLIAPLSTLPITAADGSVTLPCAYFAMEWLDGDVTEYFLRQDEYDALVKIALFRRAVLGVFRLHRQRIAHRDIKSDNLRQVERNGDMVVVPIDLGTAIDLDSQPIGGPNDYDHAVGAGAFSPIEAQLGFAGSRQLGISTDLYALGCLLHDLFNVDYYCLRLLADPGYISCRVACETAVSRAKLSGHADLLSEYRRVLNLTKHQVTLPTIDSDEGTVPNAAREQLNRLLHRLTNVDYVQREYELAKLLRFLDAATRSLTEGLLEQRRSRLRRERRERRRQLIQARQARLETYLQQLHVEGLPW